MRTVLLPHGRLHAVFLAERLLAPSRHIVLAEVGASYEIDKVDTKNKTLASGRDWLAINPKGYVPALQIPSGEIITEGAVIVRYLADQFPAAKLAPPNGTIERVRLDEWLHFIATEMHKGMSPLFKVLAGDDFKKNIREVVLPHPSVDARRGGQAVPDGRAVLGGRRVRVLRAPLVDPSPEANARPVAHARRVLPAPRAATVGAEGTRRGRDYRVTRYEDAGYAALRIVAGFMFLFHGVQKVLVLLTSKPQPEVFSEIWVGGVIGARRRRVDRARLVRAAGRVVAAGTMAVAYFQFHWQLQGGAKILPIANGGELSAIYCFVFLLIAIKGAGAASMDHWMRRA